MRSFVVVVICSIASLAIAVLRCDAQVEYQMMDSGFVSALPGDAHPDEEPTAHSNRPWGLKLSDVFQLNSSDRSLQCLPIEPDIGPRNWSLIGAYGYESFRGVSDQGWQNDGLYGSLNFGARLGEFGERTGWSIQGGFSRGLYDWEGNPYRPNPENTMRQDFASYGFFKRATQDNPYVIAVTQDWMFTENSGRYGVSLGISQIRYRAGIAKSASNEFGVIGAFRVVDDADFASGQLITTRPLNYASLYWHHKWTASGTNTIITLGRPENGRVTGDGSLGDFLVTASINAPLNDSVGFYGNVMYMNPTATQGFDASHEEAWSFTLGVEFFPGHDSRSTTVAGRRWQPLLPIANNGSFLTDAGW